MKAPEKKQSIWSTLLLLLGLAGPSASYDLQKGLQRRVDAGLTTQTDAHDVSAKIRELAQKALGGTDTPPQA